PLPSFLCLTENSLLPRENYKPAPSPALAKEHGADAELNARIDSFLAGQNADPFGLLGPHPVSTGWAIRFFIPWAAEASIAFKNPAISPAKIADAVKLRPEGFFEAVWPSNQPTAPEPGSYKIQGRTHSNEA